MSHIITFIQKLHKKSFLKVYAKAPATMIRKYTIKVLLITPIYAYSFVFVTPPKPIIL